MSKPYEILKLPAVQIALLLAFALFLNRDGTWVPANNELVYLVYVYKAWHPHFLSTDWTFVEPTAGHAVFNYTFGWLTLLMPLQWVGWIGRVGCALLSLVALLRLGRHFKLPAWGASLGIFLWMAHWQSFVTLDSILPAFEAKNVGYACLLFAVDAALSNRVIRAGVLTGLAFSFHSAVGMWGGAALGLAILIAFPLGKTLVFSIIAAVFCIPGLLSSLPLVLGKHAITAQEAKFLVTVDLPQCLDPLSFEKSRLIVLAMMAVFAYLHGRAFREDRQVRMLDRFELATAWFFLFGVIARLAGRFDLVKLYPLRVYAVLAMLFFFWQFISVCIRAWESRGVDGKPTVRPAVLVFGVFLFLCLPSPILRVAEMASARIPQWRAGDDDDYRVAARWVAANTPETAILIAPPWRADSFYFAKRPMVACWQAPRYDALKEWRQRVESLVGDLSTMKRTDTLGEMDERARDHYKNLTELDLAEVRRRYGGDFLITTRRYPYPSVFAYGTCTVYKLP